LQGLRHSMLNLPPRQFSVLGVEVLKGLRVVLEDKLTREAEHAWGLVYSILSEMLQGRMKKYDKTMGYTFKLS
jgi:hemoglobin-like flavoprotein